MDNYKKYYGVILFCVLVVLSLFVSYKMIAPLKMNLDSANAQITTKQVEKDTLANKLAIVKGKIKKIKDSIISSQKKVYSPVESDLGNETLFFTLYNDVIEMLKANSVKIKSIKYTYNPENDSFVQFGRDVYFVCDLDMKLVSNYVHLGKLVEDIYKYPYYIRINKLEIKPYEKDKKFLITTLNLRLYAHTTPDITVQENISE